MHFRQRLIWLGDILPRQIPNCPKIMLWTELLLCQWERGQSGEQRLMETAQNWAPLAGEKEKWHERMTCTRSHQESALPVSTTASWRRSRSCANPSVCLLQHLEVCGFKSCLPPGPTEQQRKPTEREKKEENNLNPNLFKGSQRPDVPCFLSAAATVATACGCG